VVEETGLGTANQRWRRVVLEVIWWGHIVSHGSVGNIEIRRRNTSTEVHIDISS